MAYKTGGRKPLTFQLQLRGGVEENDITDDLFLTDMSSTFQKIDPGGGSRAVVLPDGKDGLVFHISNAADAAENLAIESSATDGSTALVTINQNEAVWVGCKADGDNWIHFGVYTIALT